MTLEEKIAAFEAKLHDTLTDEGYVVHLIELRGRAPDLHYFINTDKGSATYLVSFVTGEFLRVLDMPEGYGI